MSLNRERAKARYGHEKRRQVVDLLGASFVCGLMGSLEWWNRGESNPRPQAIAGRFYMRSCLI
jgi:hypothetical protein